jgi:hypothetical protein
MEKMATATQSSADGSSGGSTASSWALLSPSSDNSPLKGGGNHAGYQSIDDEVETLFHSPNELEFSSVESSTSLGFANVHIMDQMENFGYFKSTGGKPCRAAREEIKPGEREKLWANIVISRVGKVDVKEESFQIQYLASVMWRINLEAVGLSHLSAKAQESGYSFKLDSEEEHAFQKAIKIPSLRIYNSIEFEDLEETAIRIFNGNPKCNYVFVNSIFKATVHCVYQLNHFPYDVQKLPIK